MSDFACCKCNIEGQSFSYPRGDCFVIVLSEIMTENGETYELTNNDMVILEVRALNNNELLHRFELTRNDYDEERALNFVFSSDITRRAKLHNYIFDIRLILDGDKDNVVTIVERTELKFTDSVSEV